MAELILSKGEICLVDDADFSELNKRTWRAEYSTARGKRSFTCIACTMNGRRMMIHHFLLKPPPGVMVDHKNRNRFDNRRENLRIATKYQNAQNCTVNSLNTSGFKGVGWAKFHKKWRARVAYNGWQKTIGYFSTKEAAYEARNKFAREVHGEFFAP